MDESVAGSAFDGEGARRYGGRWNSPGTAVVYLAESLSLAQLEILVHLEADDVLRGHWRYFRVDVLEHAILRLEGWLQLPKDFAAWPVPASTRSIGDRWIAEGASVALSVPSVVTRGERNLLLNPAHPGHDEAVAVNPAEPLVLDVRLVKQARRT